MRVGRLTFAVAMGCLVSASIIGTLISTPRVYAQQASRQAGDNSAPIIRAETRLVLVDTVVTDKKGNYILDLAMKNFRVWEDNKEQNLKSFSLESDAGSPSSQH